MTGSSRSRVSVLTVAVKAPYLRSRTIAWRQAMSSSSGSKRRLGRRAPTLCERQTGAPASQRGERWPRARQKGVEGPRCAPTSQGQGTTSMPEPNVTPVLLTAPQVAALLQIPVLSVYAYARRPDDPLPSISIGRHRRFRRDDIDRWLEIGHDTAA